MAMPKLHLCRTQVLAQVFAQQGGDKADEKDLECALSPLMLHTHWAQSRAQVSTKSAPHPIHWRSMVRCH